MLLVSLLKTHRHSQQLYKTFFGKYGLVKHLQRLNLIAL